MLENVVKNLEEKKKQGIFPRLSLRKVLELPEAIYQLGQGEPVRRLLVFDHLRRSPGSGTSRSLITAAGSYGLSQGGYQADYLNITEQGIQIISKNESQSLIASYASLFANVIFSSFMEYWKEKVMPSDPIAIDWLMKNFKLNANDAKSCWEVFKQNIYDFKLIEKLSDREVIVSKELALSNVESGTQDIVNVDLTTNEKIAGNHKDIQLPIPTSTQPNQLQKAEIQLRFGRAYISLPHKMTEKDVEKLKKLIDVYANVVEEQGEDSL